MLTGWVGQISLAQAALMGIGAFTAAQTTNRLSLEFPYHALAAGLAPAVVAVGIGVFALRIRGLPLAIATLGFQWALEGSFLEVIRDNLDLGRPDQVVLIFARRASRRTPGRFRTRVITHGVIPSLHVTYKHSEIIRHRRSTPSPTSRD